MLPIMQFVETPVFTAALRQHLSDESYRQLQIALMLRPEQGPVIRGAGGLRKVRWATPGSGKRGGLRVIYYWAQAEQVIYMLFVYSKSEQGDLSTLQTRQLGRLVREECK
jgi:mRNA-degrading endonuclease RelE of RelBE toxin-antitoxin system